MICTIISNGKENKYLIKNEKRRAYVKIKARLEERILQLYNEGYNEFYVNCEYGIPLWAAEIINALKFHKDVRLHIIIPYEEQAAKWRVKLRIRYFAENVKSDSSVFAKTGYTDNCYDIADEMMIEKSDAVLICGEKADKPHAEKFAEQMNKKIMYLSFN